MSYTASFQMFVPSGSVNYGVTPPSFNVYSPWGGTTLTGSTATPIESPGIGQIWP